MKRLIFLFSALALCACQKIDLAEATSGSNDEKEITTPIGVGAGTAEKPWTVEQVATGNVDFGQEGWVIGYAIGAAYRTIDNYSIGADHTYVTNILLANEPIQDTCKIYIPAELSTKAMKEAFALPYNKTKFQKCVMLHGATGRYFNVNGLRRCDAGRWFEDLNLDSLKKLGPEEWQTDTLITWQ